MSRASSSILAFIQARMNSSRFPGKVLAPFRGRPLIENVARAVEGALPRASIVLATSSAPSDDPLAIYAESIGLSVFRGELNDVFARMRGCLIKNPCKFFFRVCADSPLLDSEIFKAAIARALAEPVDLVTNVFPRSFPRGRSVELLRAESFLDIELSKLGPEDREHVTRYYYRNPGLFRIVNILSADPASAEIRLTVDELDDLDRLEHDPPARATVYA